MKLDEQGRLHCEDGAAVQYPDGWGVYSWHGVRVSEEIITGTLTFEQIMAEENAEIKRVMIEKFGEGAFVEALGVKPIDVSEWGSLYRVDYDDTEPLVLVRVVDPSTDRVYYNQCPPVDDDGRKMVRAKQAVAWRFGMREDDYMPLLQA